MTGTEPTAAPEVVQWRVTGVRRWLPVLLVLSFAFSCVGPVLHLVAQDATRTPYALQVGLACFAVAGALGAAALAVVTWRTVVTLTPTAIEVRGGRRRRYPYDEVGRVYRDRHTSGAVSLLLTDHRSVRLPAPVAGLGTSGPEVDAAVEQIRGRLPAAD
ncbi:MAG TPA: hypothetical protein VGC37_17540 [Friedmanniella sp.]